MAITKCPRCVSGKIFPAWRSHVCINCGFRKEDVTTKEDMIQDAIIFWLLRNKPSESWWDVDIRGRASVGVIRG